MAVPDGEKLLGRYLRDRLEGVRVVAKTPEDTEASPWIRLTLIDAPSELNPDRLAEFYFQLDVYATEEGGHPEANRVAYAVRELLGQEQICGVYDGGVIGAARLNGFGRFPDAAFEPARERVTLTTTLWARS